MVKLGNSAGMHWPKTGDITLSYHITGVYYGYLVLSVTYGWREIGGVRRPILVDQKFQRIPTHPTEHKRTNAARRPRETAMKVVVITPSDVPKVVEIDGSYESLRDLVGGYLEALPFTEGSSVYIDEEGKLKELPPNLIATSLMRSIGPGLWPDDSICGTMVIVGNTDVNGEYDGEEHDVPDAVIKQVMEFKL